MDNKLFAATYTFYLTIFIDQMLEKDNFGIDEKLAITNVYLYTTLVALIFIQENLDLKKAKTFITQNFPQDIQKATYSTLEDMLKLKLTQDGITPIELLMFTNMGIYLLNKNKNLIQNTHLSNEELEILFSSIMFCFEVLGILADYEYNIPLARKNIILTQDNEEILEIINSLEKISSLDTFNI